jgi:hypothetical protein
MVAGRSALTIQLTVMHCPENLLICQPKAMLSVTTFSWYTTENRALGRAQTAA